MNSDDDHFWQPVRPDIHKAVLMQVRKLEAELGQARRERDEAEAECDRLDEQLALWDWGVKQLCAAGGLSAPHEGPENFRREIEDRVQLLLALRAVGPKK
jgi:hypothetical protein